MARFSSRPLQRMVVLLAGGYALFLAAVGIAAGIRATLQLGVNPVVWGIALLTVVPLVARGVYAAHRDHRWRQAALPLSFVPLCVAAAVSGSAVPVGLAVFGILTAALQLAFTTLASCTDRGR